MYAVIMFDFRKVIRNEVVTAIVRKISKDAKGHMAVHDQSEM